MSAAADARCRRRWRYALALLLAFTASLALADDAAQGLAGTSLREALLRGGPAEDGARYAPLRTLLAAPVRSGTNLAIVSHGNPLRAVAGPPYLAEGKAAVIQPLGDERFRIVARIRPDGWDAL